ncbi:MAG: hypothetical protein IPJ46_20065 [Anaerolineales bacterium]|nr:hypothetical protein [Anaerolineales bacterium]
MDSIFEFHEESDAIHRGHPTCPIMLRLPKNFPSMSEGMDLAKLGLNVRGTWWWQGYDAHRARHPHDRR